MQVSPSTPTLAQSVTTSTSSHHSPWLRETEAAAYAHVSVRTIQRWIARGLPHYAIGGVVLFRQEDIDRFIASALVIKTPRRGRRMVTR